VTPRERDALSWDGDDDPTLDTGSSADDSVGEDASADDDGRIAAGAKSSTGLPAGYTAVGRGADDISRSDAEPDEDAAEGEAAPADADQAQPMGNAALIALGVLGGVYLLYTIGWIVGGLRLQDVIPFLLPETAVARVAYAFALWIAVAAPAIWFSATVLLTRRSRSWVRFVWLAAGVVLLIPWPFAMIGAIGQ
jgi:hypothetical protein